MKTMNRISTFVVAALAISLMAGVAGLNLIGQAPAPYVPAASNYPPSTGLPSGPIAGNNLRLVFKNNSGHDVWITVIGGATNGASPGWFGTNGYLGFSSNAMVSAPFLVSKSNTSTNPFVQQLSPVPYSGRISMSLDYPVKGCGIATSSNGVVTGMQQPSPCSNPGVTPYENQWQYMEMSWQVDKNGVGSSFIDATYIDAFHFPYTILENANPGIPSVGISMSRKDAMTTLKPQFTGMWTNCLLYSSNPAIKGLCCVGNPGELLVLTQTGIPAMFGTASGYTAAVSNLWAGGLYKRSHPLKVVITNSFPGLQNWATTNTYILAANQIMVDISQIQPPPGTGTGAPGSPGWTGYWYTNQFPYPVIGTFSNNTLYFDGNPSIKCASFPVPWSGVSPNWAAGPSQIPMPTDAFGDVIGCSGNLNPVNKTPQAIFSENIGAALNVAYWPADGYFSPDFWTKASSRKPSRYYINNPYNHYAKAIHTVLKGGLGYAFAFDDLAGKAGCFGSVTNGTTSDCGVTITIHDCSDWSTNGVSSVKSGKSKKKKKTNEFPVDAGW